MVITAVGYWICSSLVSIELFAAWTNYRNKLMEITSSLIASHITAWITLLIHNNIKINYERFDDISCLYFKKNILLDND